METTSRIHPGDDVGKLVCAFTFLTLPRPCQIGILVIPPIHW
jgi:hypothetical protein